MAAAPACVVVPKSRSQFTDGTGNSCSHWPITELAPISYGVAVTFKRMACLIAAVLCLLVTLPLVPSLIASFSDLGRVYDGGRTVGFVHVEGCDRGPFIVDWQCHGTFGYADPGGQLVAAQPATTYPDITIVNGYRHYAVGDQVSASLRLGTHNAYRSGTVTLLSTLGLGLLILYQIAIILVLTFEVLRRGRVSALGPSILVVLTVLAMYGVWRPATATAHAPTPPPAASANP